MNQEAGKVAAGQVPAAPVPRNPAPPPETVENGEDNNQVRHQEQAIEGDGPIDTAALKTSLLAAMGRNRVVLSACIERSGSWYVDGEKLVMPCANGYDAGAMLAEAPLLAKKVLDICGRSFRIEPRVAEPAQQQAAEPEGGEDPEPDDGDDGPADPVSIVERVFRGRRVDAGRPATAHSRPTGANEEET